MTARAEPLVSVVMSVYDGERFLPAALASILAQTLRRLELIVVDDGSTDRSAEILAAVDDPRVVVLRRPHAGLAPALNAAIARARAPLIARMDADDVSDPDRLERQYQYLLGHERVGLLGTAVRLEDFAGRDLGTWRPPTEDADIRRRIIRSNPFAHPSVMFRRTVFEAAGGYRADMPVAQDYDLWLRMLTRARGANLARALLLRRLGPGQFGTPAETRQIRWALKARVAALRRGDYPAWQAAYLLRPLVAAALPGSLRQAVRRILPGTAGVATQANGAAGPDR